MVKENVVFEEEKFTVGTTGEGSEFLMDVIKMYKILYLSRVYNPKIHAEIKESDVLFNGFESTKDPSIQQLKQMVTKLNDINARYPESSTHALSLAEVQELLEIAS